MSQKPALQRVLNMGTPITFFHYGDPAYLKYALRQAHFANPGSPIYLLGDDKNKHYPFVTHVPIKKYLDSATEFSALYQHRSPNDRNYELNCFLRWFYIEAFCKEYHIGEFFYLDSDVLVFRDLSALTPLLQPRHIVNTGSHTGVPALTYFSGQSAIGDFCRHLIHAYTDPEKIGLLDSWYALIKEGREPISSISDMELFHLYFKDNPETTGKMDHIGDVIVETNINLSEGYEMDGAYKKIWWQNDLPYCRNLQQDRLLPFVNFHYQGDAKKLMALHYKAHGYQLRRLWESADLKSRWKRSVRKMKGRGK